MDGQAVGKEPCLLRASQILTASGVRRPGINRIDPRKCKTMVKDFSKSGLRRFFLTALAEFSWDITEDPASVDLVEADLPSLIREKLRYLPILSNEERIRAESMVYAKDRESAICSFGVRREILSRYLSVPPGLISFHENQYGKPCITSRGEDQISFNVSHSHDRFIIGICRGREIGVDIQYLDERVPVMQIAARFFGKEDTAYLKTVSKDRIYSEFYQIWTLREAYCKAVGAGLSLPEEMIPPLNPISLARNGLSGDGRTWHWYQPASCNGYSVAVVVSERTG